MTAALKLPEYFFSTFEEHVQSTIWMSEKLPKDKFREESVRRAIAASRKLMLVSPDEVQERVVKEAEGLREQIPRITQTAELISRALTVSMLLILLAALKELRDGEHGGDIAEAISFGIREKIEWSQHMEVDLEELKRNLDEKMEEIERVFGKRSDLVTDNL